MLHLSDLCELEQSFMFIVIKEDGLSQYYRHGGLGCSFERHRHHGWPFHCSVIRHDTRQRCCRRPWLFFMDRAHCEADFVDTATAFHHHLLRSQAHHHFYPHPPVQPFLHELDLHHERHDFVSAGKISLALKD